MANTGATSPSARSASRRVIVGGSALLPCGARHLALGASAPGAFSICAKCGAEKPLAEFHAGAKRKLNGRHSWCRACFNSYARAVRNKRVTPETRRRHNLHTRYRLTPADVDGMIAAQGGCCAICREALPERYHIDHCHATGRVRGVLCHGCNLKLPIVERPDLLASALAYLARTA